jgi:hypothetical protein
MTDEPSANVVLTDGDGACRDRGHRPRPADLGLSVKWDEAPLAYIIRVRGQQDDEDGSVLMGFGNGTKRVKFDLPPAVAPAGDTEHSAGIFKHVVHTDDQYTLGGQDCEYACYLIALAEALEIVQGQ